jgi:hypothetical protein
MVSKAKTPNDILWDAYTEKFNSLSDQLTKANINPALLTELLEAYSILMS